jgi:hypothetical protein
MADISGQTLNADKNTQTLSSTSTIERFDNKLQSTDYAAVGKFASFDYSWEENSVSIETCITKLNALKQKDVPVADINNCFNKLKAVQNLFQH